MKTATRIRRMRYGDGAYLFRLSEPLAGSEFVVVSKLLGSHTGRAPETYIFACDERGRITDWSELPGSFIGAMDFSRALLHADYYVTRSINGKWRKRVRSKYKARSLWVPEFRSSWLGSVI